MNILRRLPLSRLLLLCALVVAIGVSATALAFALGSGPTPPPKPLPEAVHDALTAPAVEGVSASVKLTDHLLEGASLAGEQGEAGQLAASPLLSGVQRSSRAAALRACPRALDPRDPMQREDDANDGQFSWSACICGSIPLSHAARRWHH